MEDFGSTAVSGIPIRKQGCRNEVDSQRACAQTHIHSLIKDFALVVEQGLRTMRGGIEAFLQLHPEPKLLSSSDLSEYEFSLQWDQWDEVIVF